MQNVVWYSTDDLNLLFLVHITVILLIFVFFVLIYLVGDPPPKPLSVLEKSEPKFSDLYPLVGEGGVEETENNVQLWQVEEDVPDSGRTVLRRTDGAVGEFEYWADRSVSFANLETLARKWVLVYNQPEVYLERKREIVVRPSVEDTAKTANSVFASLKTYKPSTVVKKEQCNVYRWRGKVREVPTLEKKVEETPVRTVRYSDFKKNV